MSKQVTLMTDAIPYQVIEIAIQRRFKGRGKP